MTERASHASSPRALRSAAARAAGYLMLWLILSGADPASLPAGAVAAIAATWTSLRLLPVRSWRISPAPMTSLIFRFLHQSLIAGVDVARRALDPRLPLQIGFVTYPTHLTPGTARNTFCTLSSLLPGTLPVNSCENDSLLVHCLDVSEPIAAQLNQEEALLVRAIAGESDHG